MRKGIDMAKSSNNSAHRQIPRLSLTLVLVIALFLSMLFTVYLLVRLNDRNQKIIQNSLIATPNSSAAIESGQANRATAPMLLDRLPTHLSDIDSLIVQLQDTQSQLRAHVWSARAKKPVGGLYTTWGRSAKLRSEQWPAGAVGGDRAALPDHAASHGASGRCFRLPVIRARQVR